MYAFKKKIDISIRYQHTVLSVIDIITKYNYYNRIIDRYLLKGIDMVILPLP